MPRKNDLTNKRFGMLVAMREAGKNKGGHILWMCSCDCGQTKTIIATSLVSGRSRSCGCQRGGNTTHGMSGTRTHRCWKAMRKRCNNPKDKGYPKYGGRGIRVCKRWDSFEAFYADMGPAPNGCSIDRVDNNLGYSPENCRWATPRQQANNMRVNHRISHNGENLTVMQWHRRTGLHHQTIISRIRNGWRGERIFTPPSNKKIEDLIVRVIKIYSESGISNSVLANSFGIDPSTVSRIKNIQSYKWVRLKTSLTFTT